MKRIKSAIYRRLDKAGILQHFNFTTSYYLNGKKFRIPVIHATGYQLLTLSEPWSMHFYQKLLKIKPGIFVDVGVNNGQTLLKISALDPSLKYIGFEPNANCVSYVEKLILQNKLHNCKIINTALFNKHSIAELSYDNDFASGGFILPRFKKYTQRYKRYQYIPLMPGDDVIESLQLTNISIIKADVEGVELEVMDGLQNTIKKEQPFLVLEILPVYSLTDENGIFRKEREEKLIAMLASLNYIMLQVNESTGALTYLQQIAVHGNMTETNYLFAPKEKIVILKENFHIKNL